jgi:hypothetical protein
MVKEAQQQHVDIHRKINLRKILIDKAGELKGAFYIPFIGNGDIAIELYKNHKIYGADLDGDRVKTAQTRLPDAEILQCDCDAFPLRDKDIEYSLADFDAYTYPYKAFREFWQQAKITSPCVLFFTDGEKQAIMISGHWIMPDGKKNFLKGTDARRVVFNKYWAGTILPWFTEYIKPWKVVETFQYSRKMQLYWGAIISKGTAKPKFGFGTGAPGVPHYRFDDKKKEAYLDQLRNGRGRTLAASNIHVSRELVSNHRQKYPGFALAEMEAEARADDEVVNSLFEAAKSGNVTAIQVWLYNRQSNNWRDKRNVSVTGDGGGPAKIDITYRVINETTAEKPGNKSKEG